jgi:ribulose-phosphate 3-epimerase
MLVTPSILVEEVGEFWRQVERLKPYYQHFQVDITDSHFVPSRTIQLEDIVSTVRPNKPYLAPRLIFDFHFMVEDYEIEFKKLEAIRYKVVIDVVFVHMSALKDYHSLATSYPLYKVGIVLNPEDKVAEFVKKFDLSAVPAVQIMTVSPGAQGQDFLPDMLNKIEQLRAAHYRGLIYLDGAINEKTLPIILSKKFVPDAIGPGSFFSKAPDDELPQKVKLLHDLLAKPK